MTISECFKIGYISKTHGLKGEVTLHLEPGVDLEGVASFFVEINGSLVPYFIEHLSDRGDKAFVKLESVDSIDKAEPLKGKSLFLPKTLRPNSKRGEFYDDEIVGFMVEDDAIGALGEVTEVQGAGTNRLLTVAYQGREILIPILSPFILGINKSRKRIRVSLPDGFLDI